MKILTTAVFSVLLLRKRLSPSQWLALLLLAIGVGVVQIQFKTVDSRTSHRHDMNETKGLVAVVAACFTSGLAGVYFELVLKTSQSDVWVRNVQLSLFSLLPALSPIIVERFRQGNEANATQGLKSLLDNFGFWAWATIAMQVLGGLLTSLVIKYADNILKGFATSLSIVISFLASVIIFNFNITLTFLLGSAMVLAATWLYNQPQASGASSISEAMRNGVWGGTATSYCPYDNADDADASLTGRSSTETLFMTPTPPSDREPPDILPNLFMSLY
jgi:UDP-sugar transporter A1/2/3